MLSGLRPLDVLKLAVCFTNLQIRRVFSFFLRPFLLNLIVARGRRLLHIELQLILLSSV